MTRQILEDGGWFDVDSATLVDEDTIWDGHNQISRATGTQWDHECLYITRRGLFVLRRWSQWEGSGETYQAVSQIDATEWLIRNGVDESSLPGAARELVSLTAENSEV